MVAARKLDTYTVADFLQFDLEDEWRHELIDGRIVPMSPPGGVQQTIQGRLDGHLFGVLEVSGRSECSVMPGAGVAPDGLGGDKWLEADLIVKCDPLPPRQDGIVERPVLVIEMLSPSTDREDWRKKLPHYKRLPSVLEIAYLETRKIEIRVMRRAGTEWQEGTLGPADTLVLESVGLRVSVAAIYAGTGLPI